MSDGYEPRGQPFPSRWPQGRNELTQKHEKHKTQKAPIVKLYEKLQMLSFRHCVHVTVKKIGSYMYMF